MPFDWVRNHIARNQVVSGTRLWAKIVPTLRELLPKREGGYHYSNSDPVTGQAAWYDLRIRIEKVKPDEVRETYPRFEPLKPLDHIKTRDVVSLGADLTKRPT